MLTFSLTFAMYYDAHSTLQEDHQCSHLLSSMSAIKYYTNNKHKIKKRNIKVQSCSLSFSACLSSLLWPSDHFLGKYVIQKHFILRHLNSSSKIYTFFQYIFFRLLFFIKKMNVRIHSLGHFIEISYFSLESRPIDASVDMCKVKVSEKLTKVGMQPWT